jgi:hypothetical protein
MMKSSWRDEPIATAGLPSGNNLSPRPNSLFPGHVTNDD